MTKVVKLTEEQFRKYVDKVVSEQSQVLEEATLRIGSTGPEVARIQEKLSDLEYDIGKYGADGNFGNDTKSAVEKFQMDNNLQKDGVVGNDTMTALFAKKRLSLVKTFRDNRLDKRGEKLSNKGKITGDYILVFAFPEYTPPADPGEELPRMVRWMTGNFSGDKKHYGKVGHGGCVIVTKDGNCKLFEFGRYNTPKGLGKVLYKNLGKIAKIDKHGKFVNPKQVAKIAKANTNGYGPRMSMIVDVIPLPNAAGALEFASIKGLRKYSAADFNIRGSESNNCGTYALETAIAGGVKTSHACFPTPIAVVKHLRRDAIKFFSA